MNPDDKEPQNAYGTFWWKCPCCHTKREMSYEDIYWLKESWDTLTCDQCKYQTPSFL